MIPGQSMIRRSGYYSPEKIMRLNEIESGIDSI
jgi:hypothetical protein